MGEAMRVTWTRPRWSAPVVWRRAAAATAVLAATAAALLVPAGAAQAAVPGIQRVQFFGPPPVTSDPTQLLTGVCPAGKQVLGVGGEIQYGPGSPFGQISMTGVTPQQIGTGEGVVVQAYEVAGGTPGNWNLNGYAVCANPLPGLERKVFATATDSAPFRFKRLDAGVARCSTGKKLLGAGGLVLNAPGLAANGSVILDDITPAPDLSGVTVTAFEDAAGTAANWTLTAWVVCADPLPGLQLVASSSFTNSFSFKAASVTCPAGKKVLSAAGDLTGPGGIGGDTTGASGTGLMDQIRIDGGFMPEGATVVARKVGGDASFNETWFPHAYAICATA